MRHITSLALASLLLCTSPLALAQTQASSANRAEAAERLSYEADADDASSAGSAPPVAEPAVAETEASAATGPALVAVEAVEERPICRQEKPSGSNRPVRVCRTKSQMQADRDASRARMERGTYTR